MSAIQESFCYVCQATTRWFRTQSGSWYDWTCSECSTSETAQMGMMDADREADDMDRRMQEDLKRGAG